MTPEVRTGYAMSNPAVELTLETVMAAKRLCPMTWRAQHPPCLLRKSSHCGTRRDVTASRHLVSDAAHRTPGDAGHGAKQVTCLRIAMKDAGDLSDSLGQTRSGSG